MRATTRGRARRTPLPIPDGAQPAKLTLLPLVTDLIIETVIASDAVTVMPSWIAAPHLATGRVVGVQIGSEAHGRTWYAATRRGAQTEQIMTFVDVLREALGRGDHLRPPSAPAAS